MVVYHDTTTALVWIFYIFIFVFQSLDIKYTIIRPKLEEKKLDWIFTIVIL